MVNADYDLIVIGGGAAGLTASTGAGQLGAKVLLIEKEKDLGGDCLHHGCVPSKSLIKSAYCYHVMKTAPRYGLPSVDIPPVDFAQVRERIKSIIQTIQTHDAPDSIKGKYNVDTCFGHPRFLDSKTISLNGERISAKKFIVATGSSPVIPPLEGLEDVPFLTNRNIFSLDKIPTSLVVLGGGPIGVEMAQAFARLGSEVTIIQSPSQLLPKEDEDVGQFIKERLEAEGVTVYLKSRAVKVHEEKGEITIVFKNKETGDEQSVRGEKVLVSTGRKANVEALDLEKAGIEYTPKGIKVDSRLRTTAKNIFACGDVNGGYQFTHVAGYEAGIAMVNAVMRLPIQADYTKVPWCTYSDPEIASVGYNERRAKAAGLSYVVERDTFNHNDRALAEGETEGFIKVLIRKDRPIGVQIAGYHAGDLIHEWVAAMNAKTELSVIAQAIHAYPNLSEINKTVSGNFLAPKLFNDKVKRILKFLFKLRGGS